MTQKSRFSRRRNNVRFLPATATHISQIDESLTIPLGAPLPDTLLAREIDEFCAMQTLYLLDRFGVLDEFYCD